MLPFIAKTKSPQQVMGTLVKEWMGKQWGKTYVLRNMYRVLTF
jgi:iron only hydrogenase large subunit-like protein